MSWEVRHGDCIALMRAMPDASVDAVVTDPPYELGFMGKSWDASGIAFNVEVWAEALRVLKPGGHLLAFSGSRTYHRMACAIEDAGFQIRDQIMWLYGSGFPKSLDVSKAMDKAAGAEREVLGIDHEWVKRTGMSAGEGTATFTTSTFGSASGPNAGKITAPATDAARRWSGWGTALKPAHEPICMARKPLDGTVAANVLRHGTGALNIDASRVPHGGMMRRIDNYPSTGKHGCMSHGAQGGHAGREYMTRFTTEGRWPANVLHDGSDDATEGLRDAARYFYCAKASRADREHGCEELPARTATDAVMRDPESAGAKNPRAGANRGAGAPLYYCALCDVSLQGGRAAKACVASETGEHVPEARGSVGAVRNLHPTVKPTELMRYLCRLVVPPGGLVLDPFTGSGSTGRGAVMEGFRFIGCEQSEEYVAIARARIAAAASGQLKLV